MSLGEALAIARGLVEASDQDIEAHADEVRGAFAELLAAHEDTPSAAPTDRFTPIVNRFEVRRWSKATDRLMLVVDYLRGRYDIAFRSAVTGQVVFQTVSTEYIVKATEHVGKLTWLPEYGGMHDGQIVEHVFANNRLEQVRAANAGASNTTARPTEACVVLTGNPTVGYRVYGPFDTFDDAAVSPKGRGSDVWIMTLHGPTEDP